MGQFFRDFVDAERWRFETRDSNLFHVAFREIATYRDFLTIIESRCDIISTEYEALIGAHFKDLEGTAGGVMTPEQMALLERMDRAGTELRLEIESFHIFASILLDKAAKAVGFYFVGKPDGAWTHEQLLRRLAERAGVSVPGDLESLHVALSHDLRTFRNRRIVHEGSLRTLRATGIRTGEGPRLVLTNLYPTPADRQYESEPIAKLARLVDDYLRVIVILVEFNRQWTPLAIEASRAPSRVRRP